MVRVLQTSFDWIAWADGIVELGVFSAPSRAGAIALLRAAARKAGRSLREPWAGEVRS